MPIKTFSEQIAEHLAFLRSVGLEVDELIINSVRPLRCRAIGDSAGRGEYAYSSKKRSMQNGLVGLSTWCRGPSGDQTFRTYGQDGENVSCSIFSKKEDSFARQSSPPNKGSGEKARFIWSQAGEIGSSPYLARKGIGAHGLRYLHNQYGCVAVVPCCDPSNTIQALQFLNPSGDKRFLNGSSCAGLFHNLAELIDGRLIGISESYSTSTTCFELSKIPIVCAFSAVNIPAVTKIILEKYSKSPIVIFADNDRHLEAEGKPNQGRLKALQAQKLDETRVSLAVPDFGDCEPSKEASDWNDLARIRGVEVAKEQIRNCLNKC
jgi:hypothetical protein